MCVCSVTWSCPTLWDPLDCSLPVSFVRDVCRQGWVAIPSSRGSPWPRDQTRVFCISCIAGRFLPLSHQGSPNKSHRCLYIKKRFILAFIPSEDARKDNGEIFIICYQLRSQTQVFIKAWLSNWETLLVFPNHSCSFYFLSSCWSYCIPLW